MPKAASRASPTGRSLDWQQFLLSWFALPASLVVALLLGVVMMVALGANPVTGYHALFDGAFVGSYNLGATAVKAAPLLLVGVGICIAFRANMFNIGGEGQLAVGGLAGSATALALPNLPSIVLIPLVLLAGAAGRRDLGCHPRRVQGVLQRQRDPQHDHAQPRRRSGHELPAGRTVGRQDTELDLRPHPRNATSSAQLLVADPHPRHPTPPRCAHCRRRRGWGIRLVVSNELWFPAARGRDLA